MEDLLAQWRSRLGGSESVVQAYTDALRTLRAKALGFDVAQGDLGLEGDPSLRVGVGAEGAAGLAVAAVTEASK